MGDSRTWWRLTWHEVLRLSVIVLLGLSFFVYKIETNKLYYNGDYSEYIQTAQLFDGRLVTADPIPSRILKPLGPALVAFGAQVVGFEEAFLWEVALMYIALVLVSYLFFRLFFDGDTAQALVGTILFALSYPMLHYGLDLFSETGALFFYMAGLFGTLVFLREPSYKAVLMNVLIAVFGFLWKEYSVVHCVIFSLAVMTCPIEQLSWSRKIRLLSLFTGLWFILTGLWQWVVWVDYGYTYLDWYAGGGVPYFGQERRIFMIIKSIFALLMMGWIFVPFSWKTVRALPRSRMVFLALLALTPLMVLAWGAISSRLFYVMTPAFIIAVVWGVWRLSQRISTRVLLVALILVSHIAWTTIQYLPQ